MEKQKVYEIVHSSPEIKTVGEYLLNSDTQLQNLSGIKVDEKGRKEIIDISLAVENFLNFTSDPKDPSADNRSRITAKYTPKEKAENQTKKPELWPLKTGTKLVIPEAQVNRTGLLLEGIEVVSNNEPAFKAKQLVDLENDKEYTPVNKSTGSFIENGDLKQMYPDITVWIWCRSLSPRNAPDFKMEGEIFNITPFIEKISTGSTKNGGNFQMTLAPIIAEVNEEGKWVVKKSSMKTMIPFKKERENYARQEYLSDSSLYELRKSSSIDGDRLVRNKFLFHNIIGTNDLVFIRFETLKKEVVDRFSDSKDFYVNKELLAGKIYDMIGLIDSNTFSFNPNSNDVSIEINGRDLSKIFIEDGTYFYALESSQGKPSIGGSRVEDSPLSQRILQNGSLQLEYLSLYFNNSIERVLKFIIQQLSTISIVPDNLFTSYPDTNTRVKISDATQKSRENIEKKNEEYRKEAIELIGQIRKKNSVIVKEKTNQTKTEEAYRNYIYNNLKDFLDFIRLKNDKGEIIRKTYATTSQTPETKTLGWNTCTYKNDVVQEDTYPSFMNDNLKLVPAGESIKYISTSSDEARLISLIDQVLDNQSSISKFEGAEYESTKARGIWQIVKLVIDESVTKRRILDSSLSSANGSLLNFVRKICQEPFVEYYMDTYGDKFYIIVRRPPTNREGYLSLLQGTVSTEEGIPTSPPGIIDIEPLDVIQESLNFDDSEAYTWYHFTPQASFIGDSSNYSTAAIPALCFEEYGEIWGSKSMDIVHNYSPYLPYDKTASKETSILERQVYEDMKFLVDSNAYLPFTRKGTLVVNGDRRLKIGNLVRYKETGEIFKIESVQQSFSISDTSIDRTTTIQVSRGMVEKFIYGVDISLNGVITRVSYFDIINTELDLTTKTVVSTRQESIPNPDYVPSTKTKEREHIEEETVRSIEAQAQSGLLNINTTVFPNTSLQRSVILALSKLVPEARSKFHSFFLAIREKGYDVLIQDPLQVTRTPQQQISLILKNKDRNPSWYSPEAIAAAKRGDVEYMSRFGHVNRTALDFNLYNRRTKEVLGSKKLSSREQWIRTGVPKLAEQYGLVWGGKYVDYVHFEYETDTSYADDTEIPETIVREIREPSEIIDPLNVFKNFKVNKGVFNFFLRREQFNYDREETYLIDSSKSTRSPKDNSILDS